MEKFLALKASAGSGKTFSLVVRYLSLLFSGAKPQEILALTFTNKAVFEMQERIYKVLLNLPTLDDYLIKISQTTNLSKEDILVLQSEKLKEFRVFKPKILTIDSFFGSILRKFCWYQNLSYDFSIASENRDFIVESFLDDLNDLEFSELIKFAYISAEKLDDIISLFYYLYSKDRELKEINFEKEPIDLAILEEQILLLANQIKSNLLDLGLSESATKALQFKNIDELISKTWLKEKESLSEYQYFKKAKERLNPSEAIFTELRALIKPYFLIKELKILKSFFKLYNRFKNFRLKIKKSENELTFDDVLNLVYELLRGDKKIDSNFLYFRLDSKVSHILIDEFQDTSILQFEVIEPLIEEYIASDNFKTLFYVGDTKQAIYRFRGGKVELFDYLLKKYSIKVDTLKENFRSCENIVNFVNDTFSKAIDGYENQLPKKSGGYVEIIKVEQIFEELKIKLEYLLSLNIEPSKIAILTFTNSDIDKIEIYLKEHFKSLEIKTESKSKLINRNTVRAVISLIKYLYFLEYREIYKDINIDIYKVTFLSLIGLEPFSEIDFKLNLNRTPPYIIKDIMTSFKLSDEDILSFLEHSFKYESLSEFIYEIENLEAESIKDIDNGVTILTIHKSKGLEFEHLIVLDSLAERENSHKSSLIFNYQQNGIKLNSINYRFSGREFFDDDYKKVLDYEANDKQFDLKNLLYVAFTRAKESLFIIHKTKSSKFSILNLNEFKIGELKKHDNLVVKHVKKLKSESLILRNYGRQSDFIKDENSTVLNIEAINYGLCMHSMIESLDKLDINSLPIAKSYVNNRYRTILGEKIEDIEIRVKNLLQDNKFLSLIDGAKIYKELSLSYEGKIYRIDLLAIFPNQAIIFDFKSSKDSNSKYIKQIESYKKAINSILNIETEGYIIFLNQNGTLLSLI